MSYIDTINIQAADNATIDAFGKIQTSSLYNLFDSKQLADNSPLFWDEVTISGGTATHSISGAQTIMEVFSSGDAVIRQTKQRFNYQSGKGQDIILTGVLGMTGDITAIAGYYNSDTTSPYNTGYDGVWFQGDSTGIACVIYKNGTEQHKTYQSNWNIDRMDGSRGPYNPSGITVNWTKSQILHIDFEWLGVGRVRWFLVIDGKKYHVHEYLHANNSDSQNGVYMSSPNHSVRYEIRSNGGSGFIKQICSSVSSQGGVELNGVQRVVRTPSAVTVGTGANECILAIRLKQNYECITMFLNKLALYNSSGNDDLRWYIALNATLTTPLTEATSFTSLPNSSIEYYLPDDTVTDEGIVIEDDFLTASSDKSASNLESSLRLGSKIDGTRDIFYVCIDNIGATATSSIWASLKFRELI